MTLEQSPIASNGVTGSIMDHGFSEFLTFRLGSEEYGIEILKVQEIRGYDAITQIANAPDFIKGVVNLRGIIVPIIDMRIKSLRVIFPAACGVEFVDERIYS